MKKRLLLLFTTILTSILYYYNNQSLNVIFLFLLMFANVFLNFIPSSIMAFIILTIGNILQVFNIQTSFNCFSSTIIWQIVAIIIIAKAFMKSGLIERVSYKIIKYFGKSTLTLCYGISFTNLLIASVIPSSMARIGGVILPIIKSMNQSISSKIDSTRTYNFLLINSLYSNVIITPIFLTSITNLLIKNIAFNQFGIRITWYMCFINAICPALFCLFLMPLIIYHFIYKPEIEDLAPFQECVKNDLSGSNLTYNEKYMIFVALFLVFGWVFGDALHISSFIVTLIGLSLVLLTDILNYETDIFQNSEIWNLFLWLSVFILITNTINEHNIADYFVMHAMKLINSTNAFIAYILIVLLYAYSHYFFVSTTVHASTLYHIFLVLLNAKCGNNIFNTMLLLQVSNLFASLADYSSTEAILISNIATIERSRLLKFGLIFSTIIFIIWMTVGMFWWKITGLI